MEKIECRLGDCYRNAANTVIFGANFGNEHIVLVHGRPRLTCPPYTRYGHAWVEVGDIVYDVETNVSVPKEIYYAVGNIDPGSCTTYTFVMVQWFLSEYGHYGPWEGIEAYPPTQPRNRRRRRKRRRTPGGYHASSKPLSFSDARAARIRKEYIPAEDPERTQKRFPRKKRESNDDMQCGRVSHDRGKVPVQPKKRPHRPPKVSTPVLTLDQARRFIGGSGQHEC